MLQNKKIIRIALWVSFLACLPPPTSASAKSLEWKFAVGNAYQVKLEQAVEQTTTILLQPVQAKTTIEMEVLWKITAIRPNGDAELSQTLERLSLQVQSADAVDVDYDSAREEQTTESATALHQSIAPLLNTPVQVIMRPDGQIVEVKATEESLEKLRGAGGSVKHLSRPMKLSLEMNGRLNARQVLVGKKCRLPTISSTKVPSPSTALNSTKLASRQP